MTWLAIVWPVTKLRFDAVGRARPAGKTVTYPGAVGLMIGGPMDGPHALALNERLLDVLAEAFGDDIIAADGGLDRAALAAVAFADPDSTARLGALMHPVIRDRTAERFAASTAEVVVAMAGNHTIWSFDPVTGEPTANTMGSESYRPPPTMARYVKTRDQRGRAPGGDRPAIKNVDLDHAVEVARRTAADRLDAIKADLRGAAGL